MRYVYLFYATEMSRTPLHLWFGMESIFDESTIRDTVKLCPDRDWTMKLRSVLTIFVSSRKSVRNSKNMTFPSSTVLGLN